MIARVLQVAGGTYRVLAEGREFDCSLRGRLKLDEDGSVAVGDLVDVETLEDGSRRITEVRPRESALVRRAVARRKNQVMAANVHQVAVVVAAARPEPDLYMLDRLLAVAELDELGAFVVFNKTDLVAPPAERRDATETGEPAAETLDETEKVPGELSSYRPLGYDVLPTSALEGSGLERLQERLFGKTTVLAGASGVGKSSLLNALSPELDLRVGDVGGHSGRGRHTTTAARLIPLGDETFIADTPGIQHFVPTGLDVEFLEHAFREFRPYLGACRFTDCRHRQEPGCAVLDAVERGDVAERRHESYLTLLEEAETAEYEARTGESRSGG